MQNIDKWQPTKFIYKNGKLKCSRDTKNVSISSRLAADLVADFYGKIIPENVKGRLLDLGCGKVPFYNAYKPYVSENICVDWGNTLHKNIYLDYECDLNQKLFFENNEFDTIILSDVLEHIREPELLFGEMSRILKKDGKLILNVPFYYWIHEHPHDYYRYTKYALENFAIKSNFKIELIRPIGGAPEVIADILSKNIVNISLIGPILAKAIQSFTWFFINTAFGKRRSISTSENFPFGYFMILKKNN